MTEQEAKTKWCPMVRCSDENGLAYNRLNVGPTRDINVACIGSGCMMWRATGAVFQYGTEGQATGIEEKPGYCGLAGKP